VKENIRRRGERHGGKSETASSDSRIKAYDGEKQKNES